MAEILDFEPLKTNLSAIARDVEGTLDTLLSVPAGGEARVVEAMRYALFAGGKRMRPFLTVAAADLFGVSREASLRAAAAVECVHTYSLVHDDLPAMDDDDLRRGQPTTHKQFDEATAVLAGDALLTFAFEVLSDEATHPDPRVRIGLVSTLARASGHHGMVGGQMIDLRAEAEGLSYGEEQITRLQQMKTGALITAAVEMGAVLGKAGPAAHHALISYARSMGFAFQIADDILDLESSAEALGKATQKDDDAGKATLVNRWGVDKARAHADFLVEQSIDCLAEFGDKARLLKEVALYAVQRKS
ncbi:farnesyl-diphosphate synthase [Rhodothalassium salexigens DSM 2132]|uniref:Farnesyl-diphosphate synthase n=1 Tax=Rhodothalassium salexigens DSM 2132 TaxID=1188247 RepID=A0A4R2PDZ2_RHOSA|nr:farnesyl diphosphate synthase [Rhodothalassium salexigens]MBB4211956.1 farnesyl diphosphate synthase [Rhodothalassium salexigens DSM 2132]MBK1638618.1 farnesyl-diphosphate synthase [Rhodothalassium salexigens DSM 2132]TCP33460.1 farnesyl-diphosphate synthase [Rhodothalassium salexigens DSM 2132]